MQMEGRGPSRTARGTAMGRAAHYILDDEPKILADRFARPFTGFSSDEDLLEELRKHLSIDLSEFAKMRAFFALRNRYAEDELEQALERGVANYVILGAGLDSFAFRRPDMMRRLDVYEVDHPASQTWKRERLAEMRLNIPTTLHFVPVDFERETLSESLAAGGLNPGAIEFFSWLGVTQYLSSEAVLHTLREITSVAGSGSELVIQFIIPPTKLGSADRALVEALATRAAELGEPWLSFFEPDDIERCLEQIGFGQVSHFGPEEASAKYLSGRSDGLSLPGYFGMVKAKVV